jgi:shikimate dehydrogenase
MAEIKHAFVCGHPISHSRSPMIHSHWLKTYGISGDYQAVDVPPEVFDAFIANIRGGRFVGGNVTIPHKEAAFALADSRETVAELIGAANTLWLENGTLWATNTDAHGFAANLDEQALGWDDDKTALVIGAGGASRAVIHALVERGFSTIHVANRTEGRARELADRFGEVVRPHPFAALNELATDAGLLVNTTSLGMKGEGAIPLDMANVRTGALVTDIVYVPLITPFLADAMAHGLAIADGLGMLIHQAVPGFEKWFGVSPQVTKELRDMIIADMERAT